MITAQQAALANERAAVNMLIRRMNAAVLLLKGLGGVRLPGHHASDGARSPGREAPDVSGS